ncbi:uncharacterized protein LOC126471290 [Schistocerca serialis cubense]|uniref:uncharacterized protein LOC126471290 n=1 Tax=Schistocerca serialis cubense TaxID=2023355 RepID=UPI00214DFCB4|nr:uncharacterized protein LOC126471290 [Schistocerca serialis cubense]
MKYCFAAYPYAGKHVNEKNHNSGTEIVRRLIEMSNLNQSGRNVTMDRNDDDTLARYVPKKGKVVTVLSTQHHDMTVMEEKPDIILFYNCTKSGVDTFDKRHTIHVCISRYTQGMDKELPNKEFWMKEVPETSCS